MFQPLIHHPSLMRIISQISLSVEDLLQKIREFLSFHTDQMMIKKVAHQTFLKKGPVFVNFHWRKASLRWQGSNHWRFHKLNHYFHIFHVKSQWRKRWFVDSIMWDWQKMQGASGGRIMPLWTSLSLELILSLSANQVKTSIMWGTNPLHILLMKSGLEGQDFLSSSKVAELTKKEPFLLGAHIR